VGEEAKEESVMEDFPIWLKGAIWLIVCGTVVYVIAQSIGSLMN
jgi:hypothetical protein